MADTASTTPLLNFSTLLEGPIVGIDGERYHVRHPDGMCLGDFKRVELAAPRMAALTQAPSLTPAESKELSQVLDTLCRVVLDAPAEVHDRLHESQRVAILNLFMRLLSVVSAGTGATATAALANRKTGAKSSRGSRGSTAGRQKTGSGVSRSR
jgi:hypothetical protein